MQFAIQAAPQRIARNAGFMKFSEIYRPSVFLILRSSSIAWYVNYRSNVTLRSVNVQELGGTTWLAKDAGRLGRENATGCDFQLEAASLGAKSRLRARGIKLACLELVALGPPVSRRLNLAFLFDSVIFVLKAIFLVRGQPAPRFLLACARSAWVGHARSVQGKIYGHLRATATAQEP